MAQTVASSSPTSHYLAAVDRLEELSRLQDRVQEKKSLLVFGPEGVGKTRLLRAFAAATPLALYVGQPSSPRDLLIAVLEGMSRNPKRDLRLPSNPKSLRTTSLKGITLRALDQYPFFLVVDHLSGPSRVVTGLIKEMNYYGRTPIIFASRTPHMEDIGALLPMCADRSERLEIKNFPTSIAVEFARRAAEKTDLHANNLDSVIHSLVEWCEGNPGSILEMIRMAQLPRYRMDSQVKAHVLYLDYRMGRR